MGTFEKFFGSGNAFSGVALVLFGLHAGESGNGRFVMWSACNSSLRWSRSKSLSCSRVFLFAMTARRSPHIPQQRTGPDSPQPEGYACSESPAYVEWNTCPTFSVLLNPFLISLSAPSICLRPRTAVLLARSVFCQDAALVQKLNHGFERDLCFFLAESGPLLRRPSHCGPLGGQPEEPRGPART